MDEDEVQRRNRSFVQWVDAWYAREQQWRDWLEAMAREDDARAVGKRGQVEASWAAMRERWKDEGDR